MRTQAAAQQIDRSLFLDVVRSLAIFLVVVVHTNTLTALGEKTEAVIWPLAAVFLLAKVCVPLFVMLSGALLLPVKNTLRVYATKRSRRLLVPWVMWTLAFVVAERLFFAGVETPLLQWETIARIRFIFLKEYWYIPMIIGVYFLLPMVSAGIESAREKTIQVGLAFWAVTTSLLPAFFTTSFFTPSTSLGFLPLAGYFLGYAVMGWYLHQLPTYVFPVRRLVMVIALMMAGYAGIYKIAPTHDRFYFFIHDYFSPFIVITTVCVWLLLHKIVKSKKRRILPSWQRKTAISLVHATSQISFGIYFLHPIVIRSLLDPVFTPYSSATSNPWPLLLIWMAKALLAYFSSVVILLGIKRIPGLRSLFL
jgi:surface polysaccharide O-acyltransferase-like enzyme